MPKNVVKFPNEAPPVYGTCHCGGNLFRFRMSAADHDKIVLVECANPECMDSQAPYPDEPIEFECEVDG